MPLQEIYDQVQEQFLCPMCKRRIYNSSMAKHISAKECDSIKSHHAQSEKRWRGELDKTISTFQAGKFHSRKSFVSQESDNRGCSICLEEAENTYELSLKFVKICKNGHYLHECCLEEAKSKGFKKCPMCRQLIQVEYSGIKKWRKYRQS